MSTDTPRADASGANTAWTPADPQRLRHGRGEALARRDLADQARLDDQVRWAHNRALHSAYGVVAGMDVAITTSDSGARTARVGPGLAYDRSGRELILREHRRIEVPHDGPLLLVVAREETSAPACAPPLGGYLRDGRVPDHDVVLRWLPRSSSAVRSGVPLATDDPQTRFRPPRVRPLARPRIGHGATIPGQTAW
jgi:hypothetical protein